MNAINKNFIAVAIVSLLFVCAPAFSAEAPIDLAAARATDPSTLGWMVGSPPPPDKQIKFADGTYYRFPQWRWSFSHWRELRPTAAISRGSGPTHPLPSTLRTDLDAVTFTPMGGTAPMTWADSLVANYTDGIVVLHRGRIVYERYFGALTADRGGDVCVQCVGVGHGRRLNVYHRGQIRQFFLPEMLCPCPGSRPLSA